MQRFVINLDENGQYLLETASVDDGSYDNCYLEQAVAPNQFNCEDIGVHVVTRPIPTKAAMLLPAQPALMFGTSPLRMPFALIRLYTSTKPVTARWKWDK
ncbi:MAG: hypothetical protein R2778_17525 [Saprospiraceae bacterium]